VLWKLAGVEVVHRIRAGMGATLGIADDRGLHLDRRRTSLAFQNRVGLPILLEGDRTLLNIYSVMEV